MLCGIVAAVVIVGVVVGICLAIHFAGRSSAGNSRAIIGRQDIHHTEDQTTQTADVHEATYPAPIS